MSEYFEEPSAAALLLAGQIDWLGSDATADALPCSFCSKYQQHHHRRRYSAVVMLSNFVLFPGRGEGEVR